MRSGLPAGSIDVKPTVNVPVGAVPLSARAKLFAAAVSCAGDPVAETLTLAAGLTDVVVPTGNSVTRASETEPARTAATASVSTNPGALTRTTTRSDAVTPASWNEPFALVVTPAIPSTVAVAPCTAAPVAAENTSPF